MRNGNKLKNMTYIALGAVILAVCAFITVPSVIPFTMQSLGVFSLLLVFGGKRGTLSVAVYIALGAIGIPVFSGFGAGIGVLFGPTGGYLIGFILMGLLFWFCEARFGKSVRVKTASLLFGIAVYYFFGTVFYMLWSSANNISVSLLSALSVCVAPYFIPDILKLIAARFLYGRLKSIISI